MSNQNKLSKGNSMEALVKSMLDDAGPVALIIKQRLMPVGGHESVIFPPTFASRNREQKTGEYNIDTIKKTEENGNECRVAIIDTVGSQANRMEPIFKKSEYSELVPQIEIKAGNKTIHILDAGHRAADAVVRYSDLRDELTAAFEAYRETGDASRLAKISPTSLVFGAWDSRGTQAKIPRLIASTIRAYDVVELTRSAQYFPPLNYVKEGALTTELIEKSKASKDKASSLGLKEAPASRTPGGVIVRGEIQREAILSLVSLRSIGPANGEKIRRYILGLCLVAITYKHPHNLRQGCLLVNDPEKPDEWEFVSCEGQRASVEINHDKVMAFAKRAAEEFGVGENRDKDDAVKFDPKKVRELYT